MILRKLREIRDEVILKLVEALKNDEENLTKYEKEIKEYNEYIKEEKRFLDESSKKVIALRDYILNNFYDLEDFFETSSKNYYFKRISKNIVSSVYIDDYNESTYLYRVNDDLETIEELFTIDEV